MVTELKLAKQNLHKRVEPQLIRWNGSGPTGLLVISKIK